MAIDNQINNKCDLNIDNIIEAIIEQTLSQKTLIEFVAKQWCDSNFFFSYVNIHALKAKIDLKTNDILASFHGRKNQPLSCSHHIYGSYNQVSARLVFDPPLENPILEEIEPHTHPVYSIIIVTKGGGEFFLLFRKSEQIHYLKIPLFPGAVVCFPASIVHTMKPGREGIETLNVTDRLNQPPYRDNYFLDSNGNSLPIKPTSDFAKKADIPQNLQLEDYFSFLEHINFNN